MAVDTVAILYPGDMGSGVGGALHAHGHDVITCLKGRSEGSRMRAERAGFRVVADLETVAAEADLILSILPPEAALDTARAVADAMGRAGRTPPYADCNAVSPDTTREIGAVIERAGAPYIDGGIVGNPPGTTKLPVRFYVSGPQCEIVAELHGKGIDVRPSGPEIGRASAIKMCYAAVSKGTNTLHTAALMAAEALGVGEVLREEWQYSAPAVYDRMKFMVPRLPADSKRWIREMEEIAHTFESVGVTPHFHEGARDVYELLARTPFAEETKETIDKNRTVEQSVEEYVRHLPGRKAAE